MSEPDEVPRPEPRPRYVRRRLIAPATILVLGCALAITIWSGRSHSTTPAALTIVPSPENVALWQQHTITSPKEDHGQPPHTIRYVDGELRIGSVAANTSGNRREIWALQGDHGDVDVTIRIEKPSSLGGPFKPQTGLALRLKDDGAGQGSALVIDNNIWGRSFDQLVVGLWTWPADTTTGIEIIRFGDAITMHERTARIIAASRTGEPPRKEVFALEPTFDLSAGLGFTPGDRIDIDTPGNPGFSQKGALVTEVAPKYSWLTVNDQDQDAAASLTPMFGSIRYHSDENGISPKALYPRYIRARIVGSTLQVKTWLADEPESGWQFQTQIPKDVKVPESGKIGFVANHLYGADRYLAFSDVEITPITTP